MSEESKSSINLTPIFLLGVILVAPKALGCILFIDEAYSLTASRDSLDYGFQAVDSLLKVMEDHQENLVVIVAGWAQRNICERPHSPQPV